MLFKGLDSNENLLFLLIGLKKPLLPESQLKLF